MLPQQFTHAALLYCIGLLIFIGCVEKTPRDIIRKTAEPESLEYNRSAEINHADGFRIYNRGDHKLLEVFKPYQDRTDTLRYILVKRGEAVQDLPSDAQIIETPIRSMIATSTTQVALTDMLNSNQILKGIVGAEYIYNPDIRKRIEEGTITAFPEGEFNKELALTLDPDIIMVSGGQSSQFDDYQVLMDSGIKVVVNSEWLETTPLGKAEWVKMMAALLDKESLADQKFSKVASRYKRLKNQVRNVDEKPMVINNLPYKGAWFVSGGNSFTAQYLKDAGADYPWFDNSSTGGLRKGFEAVYEMGLQADVWINPGAAQSKIDLLRKDSRFRDFKSFQNGRIYNNNKRMGSTGGNDFWESGVIYPDRVLADLIHIFHPEILDEHTLFYYQKINGR